MGVSDRPMVRKAVVTGGGSGIGRAICHAPARDDFGVIVVDKESESELATAQQVGGRFVQADLSSPVESAESVARSIGKDPIDLLVNCAGVILGKSSDLATIDDWMLTMSVNLYAPFFLTRSLAPNMVSGSAVVNVTSISAEGIRESAGELINGITPMGRWAATDEVAHAVHYLGSQRASFITGQVLTVDGGLTTCIAGSSTDGQG